MDLENLQAWHDSLTASPKDGGKVLHCVIRPAKGARELSQVINLSPNSGIEGDRWGAKDDPNPKAQISLMNIHVASSCAESSDEKRLAMSGDNLLVDLDLTTANLQTGTVLEIGTTELVVTDQPHKPCSQYVERFGQDAATRIAWSVKEGHRGRGVLCQIQQGGQIRVGDSIRVKRV